MNDKFYKREIYFDICLMLVESDAAYIKTERKSQMSILIITENRISHHSPAVTKPNELL